MHQFQPGDAEGNFAEPLPQSLRLYSVQQTARILQVTDQAVRRLIFSGQLAARRVGILIRIPEASLEAFLEANPCTTPDPRRDSGRWKRKGGRKHGRAVGGGSS